MTEADCRNIESIEKSGMLPAYRLPFPALCDIVNPLIRGLAIKRSLKWDKTVSGLTPLFVFAWGLLHLLFSEVICMNAKARSLLGNILPALLSKEFARAHRTLVPM